MPGQRLKRKQTVVLCTLSCCFMIASCLSTIVFLDFKDYNIQHKLYQKSFTRVQFSRTPHFRQAGTLFTGLE